MLTDDQLLRDFGLKVGYPGLGKFYLVFWRYAGYPINTLMARNYKQSLVLWEAALAVEGHTSYVESIYDATLVHPPMTLRLEYAKKQYKHEMRTAQLNLSNAMTSAVRSNPKVTDHFTKCPAYKSASTFSEPDPTDQWEIDYRKRNAESHEDCVNCVAGYVPKDVSLAAMQYNAWRTAADEEKQRVSRFRARFARPTPLYGLPETWDPSRKLYYVKMSHGDHGAGNEVTEWAGDVEEFTYNGSPLFFFQGTEIKERSDYNELIKAAHKASRERERSRKKEVDQEQRKHESAAYKRIMNALKGNNAR